MSIVPRRTRIGFPLILAMLAGVLAFAPAQAAPFCNIDLTTAPNCYVAVDDGTVIAMTVRVPADCRDGSRDCPTVFEMAGYENGSSEGLTTIGEFRGTAAPLARDSRQLTEIFDGDYATVHASVRGTGCSQGEFDLFSIRSALDGAWLIDNWIAKQDWSNREVGLMGHSYSGITATMIAERQPEHLVAMTVSGLIDDLYRGITYLGGVFNALFPPLWTLGVRPAYDVLGGLAQGIGRPIWREIPELNPYNQTFDRAQSVQCAGNVATKNRTVVNDPVVQGALGSTDGTWWQVRSLITFIDRIEVPTHIAGAYQDEQTGARGFTHLWEQVRGVPKRLLIFNGDHGTNQSGFVMNDRRAWIDHWMRGVDGGYGTLAQDLTSVDVLQEYRGTPNSTISDTRFPLSTTAWTPYYFRAGGGLDAAAPGAAEGSTDYLSGSGRQSWSYQAGPTAGSPFTTADGPDEATFTSAALTSPLSIAGPITADLYLSSSAPDTALFAQLIDVSPTGQRTYLQRGILKASHRAIDADLSDCVDAANVAADCDAPGAHLYRPWRPHTNPVPIAPGAVEHYLLEIFPVGHVFRPGHSIMVKIMAPPNVESYYSYVSQVAPAVNTLWHDASRPSSITLPVIPNAPVAATGRDCGQLEAVRCVAKPNG
ncbi:MAG TPA: CocE/NonD family hydrolase [Actinomycetota bacterium]